MGAAIGLAEIRNNRVYEVVNVIPASYIADCHIACF